MKFPLLLTAATLVVTSAAFAANGTYTNTATGGTWETTTNWAGGIVADGAGAVADFSTLDITADNTVTLGANHTLGTLNLADTTASNKWTLSGNTITFNNSGSAGVLNVVGTTPTPVAVIGSNVNAGTLGFTKTGNGTVDLNSGLSGAGLIKVSEGTLRLQNTNGSTSFSGTWQVDSGATLSVGTGSTAGNLYNSTAPGGAAILVNGTLTFNSGSARNINAAVTGTGTIKSGTGFTQSGLGTLGGSLAVNINGGTSTLSLNNTYTGGTTVTSGTLTIAASTGSIQVGNATAGVNVTSGATLAVNGKLNLTAKDITTANITNAGTITFATSGASIVAGTLFDSGLSGNTYQLISNTGTINNAGSVLIDLAGSTQWSSATLSNAGLLTFTAVPEPSTYGLIGAGAIAGVAFVRRRKNRRA